VSVVNASPAQRAFEAAAETVKDDYLAALGRAIEAQRIAKLANRAAEVAVAELRAFHGEIDDEVAA
jgi:hypothetical protein